MALTKVTDGLVNFSATATDSVTAATTDGNLSLAGNGTGQISAGKTTFTSDIFAPLSSSGEPILHFGAEGSGETGIGMHSGSENILRVFCQGDPVANFVSNAYLASQTFVTRGGITIADDAVYTLDKDDAGVFFDSNSIMIINTSATETSGIVGFRLQASTNGEIFIVAQPSTTIEVSAVASAPSGTTGVDGKLTVSTNKTDQTIHIENRRGASISVSYAFIGGGTSGL